MVATQTAGARQIAQISMAVNLGLTVAKGVVGLLTGSTAVMADALHSASDILGTMVVLVGVNLGGSPPDKTHHYGHAKIESVAAKIVSLLLIGTAVSIGIAAIAAVKSPSLFVPGRLAIIVTIASMIVKDRLYRFVANASRRLSSAALEAEALNHRGDAGASFAVLVGVVGSYFGYSILDPLAGLVVAVLIAQAGVRLYIQSVRALVDEAPSAGTLEAIRHAALDIKGVLAVNEIKARLSGSSVLVDIKLCVNRFLTVEQGHHIAAQAKRNILDRVTVVSAVLVHVNPCHHVRSIEDHADCTTCSDHTVLDAPVPPPPQ